MERRQSIGLGKAAKRFYRVDSQSDLSRSSTIQNITFYYRYMTLLSSVGVSIYLYMADRVKSEMFVLELFILFLARTKFCPVSAKTY
jgi:hypothetical protein